MKRLSYQFLKQFAYCAIPVSFCIIHLPAHADTNNNLAPASAVIKPSITPATPQIDAKAYIIMDAQSGAVLASENKDQKLTPASLTKLMTSYVASQALKEKQMKLSDQVQISERAWKMGGSRMFLQVGTQASVQDLLNGIIVASGNDACVALAEHVAGTEEGFVQLMNQTAARLGMKNTHFVDSNGLPDPNHYSTAYDLALLSRALINDYPDDYKRYNQKWIFFNNIKQPNRNRLLWRDPSVDGLKTGHTDDAGYCLVASAKRNGMRLITVVMGAPSDTARTEESQALLNWGFRFYETHLAIPAGKTLVQQRVWLGQKRTVPMGVNKDFYITVPIGRYSDAKTTVNVATKIKAPILKGNTYGTIEATIDNKPISNGDLVALINNPKGGLLRQLFDSILLLFKKGS